MTDWTLDVVRLDAIVPPEGLEADPGYEDQDPVTSHGFPETRLRALAEAAKTMPGLRFVPVSRDDLLALLDDLEAADRAVAALTPLVEAAVAPVSLIQEALVYASITDNGKPTASSIHEFLIRYRDLTVEAAREEGRQEERARILEGLRPLQSRSPHPVFAHFDRDAVLDLVIPGRGTPEPRVEEPRP